MIFTDIVFSINVHEKINFLIKQINNIETYVLLNFIIIINANNYMYNKISNSDFFKTKNNIILNKNYLNKKRFHGSLTKGIFLNMDYSIKNYHFKYFIILSSRNLFYNYLNDKNINNLVKINNKYIYKHKELPKKTWHWHSFLKTQLGKYIIENDLFFTFSAHEGLTFDNSACKNIISFLNNHENIRENLFNWKHCVEEFALQSICINLSHDFYDIGTGEKTKNNIDELPNDKFIYKTIRTD